MHKAEAEKIDSILDEHQEIYRRHSQINNILAYCACIAWIPCIIAIHAQYARMLSIRL